MTILGDRIKQARQAKGISQVKLAELLSVTRGAASQWENNATAPSHKNLRILAELLETPIAHLIVRDDTHPNSRETDGLEKEAPRVVETPETDLHPDSENQDFMEKFDQLKTKDKEIITRILDALWSNR